MALLFWMIYSNKVPTPPVIEKVHGAIFERLEAAVYKGFFVFLWQT
jgi:hypothetical protein